MKDKDKVINKLLNGIMEFTDYSIDKLLDRSQKLEINNGDVIDIHVSVLNTVAINMLRRIEYCLPNEKDLDLKHLFTQCAIDIAKHFYEVEQEKLKEKMN